MLLTKQQIQDELWKRGEISWKLHEGQVKINRTVNASKSFLAQNMAAFEEGWKLALVDRTLGDAKEKLTDIVKVALDSLKRKLPGLFEISYFQSRIIVKMTGRRASEIVGGNISEAVGLVLPTYQSLVP